MSTFLELKSEIANAVGRANDPDALSWAGRSINAGITLAGLMFEPDELHQYGASIAMNSGVDYSALTQLTRPLRIDRVYHVLQEYDLYPVEYNLLRSFPIPTGVYPKYYSLFGSRMFFRPTPGATGVLNVDYTQYPARLSTDTEVYPFARHEDFVLSFAISVTFAFLEEGESQEVWLKIGNQLGISESSITQMTRILRGEVNLDYVQNIMAKSSSQT